MEIRAITNIVEAIRTNHLLGGAHYAEIVAGKGFKDFDIDAERYGALEAVGALVCLGVYVHEALVGYSINVISTHPHSRNTLCACNDMLYISPAHRYGSAGLKLMRATKAACKAKGVTLVLWQAKPGTRLVELLPRLGCKLIDLTFSEEI